MTSAAQVVSVGPAALDGQPDHDSARVAAARLWRRRGARIVLLALGTGLALESTLAHPNYIAFFNAASGGARGGLRLLGDSNLDWGQDLLALSRWQAEHPHVRLYLCYFGSVDPAVYGIRYINLPGGTYLNNETHEPDQRGVIAISAYKLQGMGLTDEQRQFYRTLLDGQQPIEIVGSSIYLFEYPPRSSSR